MRLHAAGGGPAAVLRVYHACASTLQAKLRAAPGTALHATYERLIAAEAPPL